MGSPGLTSEDPGRSETSGTLVPRDAATAQPSAKRSPCLAPAPQSVASAAASAPVRPPLIGRLGLEGDRLEQTLLHRLSTAGRDPLKEV